MPPGRTTRELILGSLLCLSLCGAGRAQETAVPPAYLAVVEGPATLVRDGEAQPAVRDMPFVTGDRLRTEAGRVEIDFPDGTAIEVGSYSEVVALSPTRVRLVAGTMDHLPRRAVATDSLPYLPQDLQGQAQAFDQYGSWSYDTSYGYVWYPRVAADWWPYYYGSWSTVPSYGWTWIGLDAWSWPTHHYGRWGYGRNAWFWIPGRTWSAAWVAWGLTSDYVSWCPLGFDGRPVFALSAGLSGRGWNGWTVMSRSHFGYRGHYAHDYAVDPRRFDGRTPFIQTTRLPPTLAPARPASQQAVAAPAASAGVAVPRGTISTGRPAPNVEPRTTNEYRRSPSDYRPAPSAQPRTPSAESRPANAEPRTWNAEARTTNFEPRTPNPEPRTPKRFERGVPAPAPRVQTPVVPSVALAAMPPAAATNVPANPPPAPVYRPPSAGVRPPAYEARPRVSDPPERTAAPERTRAPERAAPQERDTPRSAPAPAPQSSGKAETGGRTNASGRRPR